MTQKQKENIIGAAVAIGLVGHFGISYFFWDKFTRINIYYVTAYFNIDVYGLALFMIVRESQFLKFVSMMAMTLGSYFLFMEFNDPTNWKPINYITLWLMMVNTVFFWHFAGKSKKIMK